MYNWRLQLLAFCAILHPIASFTDHNIVDGRYQCCDRQPHSTLQDSRLSLYGPTAAKSESQERRLNRRVDIRYGVRISDTNTRAFETAPEYRSRDLPAGTSRSPGIDYRRERFAVERSHTARDSRRIASRDVSREERARAITRDQREFRDSLRHYDRDTRDFANDRDTVRRSPTSRERVSDSRLDTRRYKNDNRDARDSQNLRLTRDIRPAESRSRIMENHRDQRILDRQISSRRNFARNMYEESRSLDSSRGNARNQERHSSYREVESNKNMVTRRTIAFPESDRLERSREFRQKFSETRRSTITRSKTQRQMNSYERVEVVQGHQSSEISRLEARGILDNIRDTKAQSLYRDRRVAREKHEDQQYRQGSPVFATRERAASENRDRESFTRTEDLHLERRVVSRRAESPRFTNIRTRSVSMERRDSQAVTDNTRNLGNQLDSRISDARVQSSNERFDERQSRDETRVSKERDFPVRRESRDISERRISRDVRTGNRDSRLERDSSRFRFTAERRGQFGEARASRERNILVRRDLRETAMERRTRDLGEHRMSIEREVRFERESRRATREDQSLVRNQRSRNTEREMSRDVRRESRLADKQLNRGVRSQYSRAEPFESRQIARIAADQRFITDTVLQRDDVQRERLMTRTDERDMTVPRFRVTASRRILSSMKKEVTPNEHDSALNWQYVFYAIQAIYIGNIVMQIMKDSTFTKKSRLGWWGSASRVLVKID